MCVCVLYLEDSARPSMMPDQSIDCTCIIANNDCPRHLLSLLRPVATVWPSVAHISVVAHDHLAKRQCVDILLLETSLYSRKPHGVDKTLQRVPITSMLLGLVPRFLTSDRDIVHQRYLRAIA